MRPLLVIFTAIFLLSGNKGYSQAPGRGEDIRKAIEKFGQAEVIIDYPGFDAMSQLAARFSVSSCDGNDAVLSLSPLTASDFINSGIEYKILLPLETKGFYTASSANEAMLWQSYPTWKQFDTIMHKIAGQWPEVCILDT
ncbi:MAG: hypothetical protein WCD55_08995, partial [Bacteroidales bacterium]